MFQEVNYEYDRLSKTLFFKNSGERICKEQLADFKDKENVEKVYICSSVCEIGDEAFSRFFRLRQVFFEKNSSLYRIGERAFEGTAISEFIMSDKMLEVEKCAFNNCRSLKRVVLCANLHIISKGAFSNTAITRIEIPDSVTEIDDCAFYGCMNLNSVSLGSGVKVIGADAFGGCPIDSIKIPEGVERISSFAFCNCRQLRNIEMPKSITTIGKYAFAGSGIEEIDISSASEIGECAFSECCNLRMIKLGNNIKEIKDSVFSRCDLRNLILPGSIESIGEYAFYCNNGLMNIGFGSNVREIGGFAFAKTSIVEASVPDSTEKIGRGAFSECGILSVISIGKSVKYIGEAAFKKTAPEELLIPDSVEVIGDESFCDCSRLQDVKLGNGVREIGDKAFWKTSLESISIPEGCSMDDNSFPEGCAVELKGGIDCEKVSEQNSEKVYLQPEGRGEVEEGSKQPLEDEKDIDVMKIVASIYNSAEGENDGISEKLPDEKSVQTEGIKDNSVAPKKVHRRKYIYEQSEELKQFNQDIENMERYMLDDDHWAKDDIRAEKIRKRIIERLARDDDAIERIDVDDSRDTERMLSEIYGDEVFDAGNEWDSSYAENALWEI